MIKRCDRIKVNRERGAEMSIGENIKKYRKQKGITQKVLAEIIGVSLQAVSKWECGATPDISQIIPLSKALGASPNELLDCTENYNRLEAGWHKVLRQYGEGSWEIIEYDRKALLEYPNDQIFLFRLATDLQIYGTLAKDPMESIRYLEMAVAQYLENLRKYPDFHVNIEGLVEVYMMLGRREEALKIALESDHKDTLLKIIYKGEELLQHRQMLIDRHLCALIGETLGYKDPQVWKITKDMIYAAFPDGNYQRYGRYLNMLDIRIANYCEKNGDYKGAIEAFGDMVRRCKEENKKIDSFSTPLFDRLPTDCEYREVGKEIKIVKLDRSVSHAKWIHGVMTGEYWEEAERTKLLGFEEYRLLIKEIEGLIEEEEKK